MIQNSRGALGDDALFYCLYMATETLRHDVAKFPEVCGD